MSLRVAKQLWTKKIPELGPLSGLLAAIDWAAQHTRDCTAIATVSSDVPFLPSDLVARLEASRGDGAAIATSGWPSPSDDRALADERPADDCRRLDRRALSVDRLAADLNAVAVAFPMRDIQGVEVDPFFNINTPDDLAAARALLAKSTEG